MKKQIQNEIAMFCHNIRQLRRKHALSKEEMARKLAIGVYSLKKLEKGELPPRLSCEIVFYIHEEFGVKPHEMFMPLDP